jgi:hypothetical protein
MPRIPRSRRPSIPVFGAVDGRVCRGLHCSQISGSRIQPVSLGYWRSDIPCDGARSNREQRRPDGTSEEEYQVFPGDLVDGDGNAVPGYEAATLPSVRASYPDYVCSPYCGFALLPSCGPYSVQEMSASTTAFIMGGATALPISLMCSRRVTDLGQR